MQNSKRRLWAGRVMTALPVLFLIFDGVIKLIQPAPVIESFTKLGWDAGISTGIGILELACVAVYVVRSTSVLGAILLSGYLGGAVATHLRVGDPLFSHVLFPLYVGAFLWGGLYLSEDRLRSVVPLLK